MVRLVEYHPQERDPSDQASGPRQPTGGTGRGQEYENQARHRDDRAGVAQQHEHHDDAPANRVVDDVLRLVGGEADA